MATRTVDLGSVIGPQGPQGAAGATGAQGPKGATGAAGQRGSQWRTGTLLSGTSSTTGAYYSASMPASLVGDMYLNTTYGYVYQCTTAGTGSAARWTYKGSIRGPQGVQGDDGSMVSVAATGTDYTTQRVRNVAFKNSDPGAGSGLSSGNILLVYE